MLCKKGALRNFSKFARRHLCQCFFLNKVAGLSPSTLLKKRLWHRCFPVNFNITVVLDYRKEAEAVSRGCSLKKAFLKISQSSQENTSARVFVFKVEASGLQLY